MNDAAWESVSFRAPELVQGSDEDALLTIAGVVSPGLISRNKHEGGLSLWVHGHSGADDLEQLEELARSRFSECLGVLRAMKFGRGQLREELIRSPARYASGAVVVRVAAVKVHLNDEDQLAPFAEQALGAMARSPRLTSALALYGKANSDPGDYFNIYEYGMEEFQGPAGIESVLGISVGRQKAFTASANNLAPAKGGRHSKRINPAAVRMGRDEMAEFAANFLKVWIETS
jgi:hypothetical protein